MGATDWLTKQGWSKEDAKRYVEAQEKGMSPLKAYTTVKKEAEVPVIEEFEPKTEPGQEYAVEQKQTFQPQSINERLFGRKITTDDIENAAGKVIGKAQMGVEYVAEESKTERT